MSRYLLLLLIVIAFFLVLKGFKRLSRGQDGRAARNEPAERMVVCDHCGVHLPESESVTNGAKQYCSDEHRRLDQR